MTLTELIVGLMITAMVAGALAALWGAVGTNWQAASSSENMSLRTGQVVTRLEGLFRAARYVCQWTPGSNDGQTAPASAFLWRSDYWNAAGTVTNPADFKGTVPDGVVQVAELAVVEFDVASSRIYLYQAMDPARMTADQRTRAGVVWTWADLSKATTVSTFKALDFVQKTVVTEGVTGVTFNMPAAVTGGRPAFEFTLSMSKNDCKASVYSTATLRAPAQRPL